MKSSIFFLTIVTFFSIGDAVSTHKKKDYYGNQGYYRNEDQVAEASQQESRLNQSVGNGNVLGSGTEERTQRFGITSYGGSGIQGPYPSGAGVPGVYGPVKIDLGGVLLGSMIGLGAILLLPKLVHAFSYSYGGGYGRNVEAEMSSFTNLLTKLDEVLEKNNVDSSSCAQRITCSFVQSSLNNMSGGNGTDIDKFVAVLSGNSLVDYMLDGTALKEAVQSGKDKNVNCQSLYPRCEIDKATLMKIFSNALPS